MEMTDEELIEKAKASEDGEAFAALLDGNWQGAFQSQSEADMAFCRKLAFWSGKNKEQMERIFRSSGLYRQKWDEKHHADGATYGEETLDKAIESTENVYSPGGDSPSLSSRADIGVPRARLLIPSRTSCSSPWR